MHNTFYFHFRAMQELVTIWAVPFESVDSILGPWHLDDYPNASRATLGGVAHVFGKQEHVALFDGNLQRGFAGRLHDAEKNVSLQLVKEFLGSIVMVVAPLVWSTNNGHHQLAVIPHLRITHRWLEFLFILINPRLEIERL
jgi:hypothetical protein